MFIPNWVHVYGSNSFHVNNDITWEKNGLYTQTMTIIKSGLRALDQPSQRCESEAKIVSTTSCIARYIEGQLGCNMNIYGHMVNEMLPCNSTLEYDAWRNISMRFEKATSNAIFEETGCLPSCHRNEYALIGSALKKENSLSSLLYSMLNTGTKLQLQFRIMDSSYREEEQYVIYDFNSFISDVGGFLGLLLGYSALSIYDEMASILRRFKRVSLPK